MDLHREYANKLAGTKAKRINDCIRQMLDEQLGKGNWAESEIPTKGGLLITPPPKPVELNGWRVLSYEVMVVQWEGRSLGTITAKVFSKDSTFRVLVVPYPPNEPADSIRWSALNA